MGHQVRRLAQSSCPQSGKHKTQWAGPQLHALTVLSATALSPDIPKTSCESSELPLAQSFDMRLPSSRRAMAMRCTSSGPSAKRSVRAPAHSRASGKSSETPPPPCACMEMSRTSSTVDGASTLAAAILPRACNKHERLHSYTALGHGSHTVCGQTWL